nr:transcription initiation factor iib [Quercus suber]
MIRGRVSACYGSNSDDRVADTVARIATSEVMESSHQIVYPSTWAQESQEHTFTHIFQPPLTRFGIRFFTVHCSIAADLLRLPARPPSSGGPPLLLAPPRTSPPQQPLHRPQLDPLLLAPGSRSLTSPLRDLPLRGLREPSEWRTSARGPQRRMPLPQALCRPSIPSDLLNATGSAPVEHLRSSVLLTRPDLRAVVASVARFRHSANPQSRLPITHSPLFIRCFAKQHKLKVTSKGIKRRAAERFDFAVKKSIPTAARKPLTTMAQGLSPGAVPDPEPQAPKQEEWRENLQVRLMCKDCREDPPELYEDHASGDLICASCGLVLQQRSIDMSSEWRTFSNDDQGNDDPSRVGDGPNALLNGAQLNTSIAFDAGMRNKELHRAQNKANLDKGNKGLLQAYKQIGALCDSWSLPATVSDSAKHLYKDAVESASFKGKSQEALIAGCVFLACRRNNVARSFREVMELTRVSKKEIGRTFKLLENFLLQREKDKSKTGMVAGGTVVFNEEYKGTTTADPAELCNRYCSQLGMDQRATNVASELAKKMTSSGALAGRSPLSSAAACIFMAGHLMGQVKTAKEIQKIVSVSDSTIRHAYKLLYQEKDIVLTEEILARGADPGKLPKPA